MPQKSQATILFVGIGALFIVAIAAYLIVFHPATAVTSSTKSIQISSISGFDAPMSISISSNGAFAYVTNWADGQNGTISVVDLNNDQITYSIPKLAPYCSSSEAAAISPTGGYAYASCGTIVMKINTTTNQVEGQLSSNFTDASSIAFSPNGAYAYVVNTGYSPVRYANPEKITYTPAQLNNTISMVDAQTGTTIALIGGFDDPGTLAISPNGAYAYVINGGNDTISILNLSSRTITGTIALGNEASQAAFSSNGNYAYVTYNYENTVGIINTTSDKFVGSLGGFNSPSGIAAFGNNVYVVNNGNNTISIENVSVSLSQEVK